MSHSVRLSEDDILLLIGAIVTDTINNGNKEAIHISAKRINQSNLQTKALLGPATKKGRNNKIAYYKADDILANLVPQNHIALAQENYALKRLNNGRIKDYSDLHDLLDDMLQYPIRRTTNEPRILLPPRPVIHANMTNNFKENHKDVSVAIKLQKTATMFLQSLQEVARKHNRACSLANQNKPRS